jgi:lysozyme
MIIGRSVALLALIFNLPACGPEDLEIGEREAAVHTVCGGSSTVKGIDVSSWQGTIDWTKVKASGRVFAIIRVSDGGYLDTTFAKNWKSAKSAGLIRGAYQYFRPGQDATTQANLFVDKINAAGGLAAGDLPGVIDVEASDGKSASKVAAAVGTWLARVKERTKRVPIIYTGSYFWDGSVGSAAYKSYPLWTAHYTSAACPLVPNAWGGWKIWQYSSTDSVSGISGNVDGNRFNGTLAGLKAFAAASIISPPKPKPDAGTHDSEPPRQDAEPAEPDAGVSPEPIPADGGGLPADAEPAPAPDSDLPPRADPTASSSAMGCAVAPTSEVPVGWLILAVAMLGFGRRRGPRR